MDDATFEDDPVKIVLLVQLRDGDTVKKDVDNELLDKSLVTLTGVTVGMDDSVVVDIVDLLSSSDLSTSITD